MSKLVLFPVKPTGKDAKNREKMIKYLVEERQARMKMGENMIHLDTPLPHRHKNKIARTVELKEVPDYNAVNTMRNEWCVMKYHFKWRKRDLKAAFRRRRTAEVLKKKAAKGK